MLESAFVFAMRLRGNRKTVMIYNQNTITVEPRTRFHENISFSYLAMNGIQSDHVSENPVESRKILNNDS